MNSSNIYGFGIVTSLLFFGIVFLVQTKWPAKNKIIRLVIMPPILALLGMLPWWLLEKLIFRTKGVPSHSFFTFVFGWLIIVCALIVLEKPKKERDRISWKIWTVYGWTLMTLVAILSLFFIVVLVLILSRHF